MAILDFTPDRWMTALGWSAQDVPDVLVLEGTWWRDRAVRSRLDMLDGVTETAFPDIFTGSAGAAKVAYCCAYGAARAAEVAHVCAHVGTPLVIQIGTCGALQPGFTTGTVAVPRTVLARDGVTPTYGGPDRMDLDGPWADRAEAILKARGVTVRQGPHLTWTTLFAQDDALCAGWAAEGIATVDMETAAVAAVCARFGAKAIALLASWDILSEGRTFLDPVDPEEERALAHANAAIWATALDLAQEVAAARVNGRVNRLVNGRVNNRGAA
jgi:uridine phosphorylase